MLGTVTPAELVKIGGWGLPSDDLAAETLLERSTMLAEFVDAIATFTPSRWSSRFALMRTLVTRANPPPPANDGYIIAMISGCENFRTDNESAIYEALIADPTLLEGEVWRLFEVEGGGENSLAADDKSCREARTWGWTLAKLSDDGHLPRARLLNASLAALSRDFAAFRAGWFSRFHERLAPTPAERRERERGYLALLSSPIPATVSFAVRGLVLAGGVSDQAVDYLRPALVSRATATVKAATKLLPKSRHGATLAAEALPHVSRESQADLLTFLERIGKLGSSVTNALVQSGSQIAPSLRDRLERLTGPVAARDTLQSESRVAEVRRTTPVLADPVQSVPELVGLLATVLERVDDAHDLERALDGVSRLCERTDDALKRLEPVARRARKLVATARLNEPFSGASPRHDIAGLVIAWADGETARLAGLEGERPRDLRAVLGLLGDLRPGLAVSSAGGGPERRAGRPPGG